MEDAANQVAEVVVDDEWMEVTNNDAADKEVVDIDMDADREEEKKADDGDSSEEVDIDADMDAMNNAAASGAAAA